MNRTFVNIVSNIGSNIQDTSSPMATIIKRLVNDAQTEFVRRANITLIDDDYSFDSVAGQEDYILPDNFEKEIYVYDSTNKIALERWDLQRHLQENIAAVATAGLPDKYMVLFKPAQKQPTSSSILTIVSSSASDTSQVVYVRGISSGVEVGESVSLNGTTNATTTNSYTEIMSISKSANTVGKVTVTSNSGAVTVAVFAPWALVYKVKCMRLHYIPSSVITIKAPYHMKPSTLVNDYDTLCIDADDIIEKLATSYAWRYKRQGLKAKEWLGLYEKAVLEYLWAQSNEPNMVYNVNPIPYSRETV